VSAERAVLLAIREEVDKLPLERRQDVAEIAAYFRTELRAGGAVAEIALCLVGAEQMADAADVGL
jgi:hypothetical protein